MSYYRAHVTVDLRSMHSAKGMEKVALQPGMAASVEIKTGENTVLRYLTNELGVSEEDKNRWYRHWCEQGLASVETLLANDSRVGRYCYGDAPSLADCLLIPQIANAERLKCDLSGMPTILRINAACLELASFIHASPASQPDAE